MTLGKKDLERIAWVESFTTGKKWFLKLRKQYGKKEGTQKNYSLALERFCEYLGKNPDEIITAYKEALAKSLEVGVSEWNDNLDLFVPHVIDKYGLSRSRAKDHFAAIKSFFEHNSSIGLSTKTPEAHSKEILPVTLDEIRDKILPHADIQERFIVLFLKDCGVSQAEGLRFNVGTIEDLGNGFGYMRVFREKENVNYETFIGPNATTALKQYLEYRKRNGETITNDSPLITKKNKLGERMTVNLITYQLKKLGEKAGVNLSTHRLRKFFETTLATAKVHPIILKYWMGHKVKGGKNVESRYIIPTKEAQTKLYIDSYKYIDVTPKPDETAIFLAETRTRMSVLPPEQRARFLKEITTAYRSRAHLIQNDKRIQELLAETNITQGGLPFGKPPFEEIEESKLLMYLNSGWELVHTLQNGNVIVKRKR